MGQPVFGKSILELRRDWPTVCGQGSQRSWRRWVASLSSVGTAGKGDKTVPDVPAGSDLFQLGPVPRRACAHVPGELRVDERDRIIAIAATDAEVAYVGGDRFGFREAFGELEDTAVGHVHRWPIVRDRSANLFGFPVEHGLNDHPALPRQREQEVDGPRGVGEEVAGFGPHDLAGDGRFAKGIRDFSGSDRGG